MKRVIVVLALLFAFRADAHVGSPDVFFEGDAGPYKLFVTVRTPQVIPGIADIEIRSESPDVTDLTVVPLRLTGPGSELPPTPDHADRSRVDPQFFTAQLWLMEHGSLQVRITANGARGTGTLAVPVAAFARSTLQMSTGLGALLALLMLVLAISIVAILAGAAREATLEPGESPAPAARRRTTIATLVASAIVLGLIALGNLWWNAEANNYNNWVQKPWVVQTTRDGCTLRISHQDWQDYDVLLRDHGHLMHLFLVSDKRDRIAHLHPEPDGAAFTQRLPSLPAGRYQLYADIVFASGFPITGTATLDLPDLHCDALTGDDSTWAGPAATGDLAGGAKLIFDRPAHLRANVATPLHFHVVEANGNLAQLEPYMGMTAHAAIVGDGVFAHLHPSGSVAMPALELAQTSGMSATMRMGDMAMPMPPITPDFQFPYGFPKPGDYRIFVQIKRAGAVETGAFDIHVDQP